VASTAAEAAADRIAAEHAAASLSAPLDRFTLANVHTITPTTTAGVSTNSDSEGFHFGDAAVGAGLMAGLVLLGTAGAFAARRRRQPVRP
jgi:LPXTG-motif cell wall-anchored protein